MMNKIFLCLFLFATAVSCSAQTATSAGFKVLTAGHSFHVWMPAIVAEMANAAGIKGHEQLGISSIGGSQVIQHWNLPLERNKAKVILEEGKADIFTMSPTFLPDEGIENFVKLGMAHRSNIRFTVQQNWVPFEDAKVWLSNRRPKLVQRDDKSVAQLRAMHAEYFEMIDRHVRILKEKIPHLHIAVVPCGEAVIALRAKVISGEVPGVSQQSELFRDALGHPEAHIRVLSAYCHFSVIYRRSPVGLPVNSQILKMPESERLNRLLQEIAWKTVEGHSLSGVPRSEGN